MSFWSWSLLVVSFLRVLAKNPYYKRRNALYDGDSSLPHLNSVPDTGSLVSSNSTVRFVSE